ncbi:MAG: Rieske (2Fe-2S) protein [bacterium]
MKRKFVAVGKVDDFPVGKGRKVVVDGREIAVFHLQEGFFAIDDTCPHQGAPLSYGIIDGFEVACPRHGARFDLRSGQVLSLPAVRGVISYEVQVDKDMVFVCPEPMKDVPPALLIFP